MSEIKKVIVIGAGHAGVSAAISAAKLRKDLNQENAIVEVKSFLTPIGVHFIKDEVIGIDTNEQSIKLNNSGKKLNYDSLIMCAGSELAQPKILGIDSVYNIDTYKASLNFREALSEYLEKIRNDSLPKLEIAVLGGGITGIELACELPVTLRKLIFEKSIEVAPKLTVYLLDRGDVSLSLGEKPREYLEKAFEKAKVTCLNHVSIVEAYQSKEDQARIKLDNKEIKVNFIVSTLGVKATKLNTFLAKETDRLGRVRVNQNLQTKIVNVFIAGDAANVMVDEKYGAVMSCQHGRVQGRMAGYNAIAYLCDKPLLAYFQPNYVTCVDLGDYGALYTEGWDREVKKFGKEAKVIKSHINLDRIYPSRRNNADGIFETTEEIQFTAPTESIKTKENL